MQNLIMLLLATMLVCTVHAQNSLTIFIKDKITKNPLPGVTLQWKETVKPVNSKGFAEFTNIPDGVQSFRISCIGYTTITENFIFPNTKVDSTIIFMEIETQEEEEVIIQSTRTSRTIKTTPTRVEIIDGEELDEKNNMRPANVSMLLHESTGLQVQQTSATSANASIRVQGLDGRYTQLLKDGYPNFGNFASGLSVLEIPPIDLKQVEVIKGPASTLYGGGAIAGVVNFISKTPKEKGAADFIINQSNIGQTNIGGFIAKKKGHFGYTFTGLVNFQKAYDVDKDDFSELPESKNFTIHPRLFYYPNSSTTVSIGNSFTKGTITGGDMEVIRNKPDAYHTYFEKNTTNRNITTLEMDKKLAGNSTIRFKQSLSIFNRAIHVPTHSFSGKHVNNFTDLSLVFFKPQHTLIAGLNLVYDRFRQEKENTHNANSITGGVYVQDTWDLTEKVTIESGLRLDQARFTTNSNTKNQIFVLPRISALFIFSNKLSSRIGGGLGYKLPSIFTEQTESMEYQNVLSLSNSKAEKSIGGTADINFRTTLFDDLAFSINHMFYYTGIHKPLVLLSDLSGNYYFTNASKPIISKGMETNIKFIYKEDLKLFMGYTYTNASATYKSGNQFLALLPKNKLNLTLMYEKEDNFKIGLEGYFTDKQFLYNGNKTPSFWEFGFMAQKTFHQVSVFVNFENFTDQRQSNYKSVVNLPHQNPTFDDIWNHTEGFIINGGIKLKF